MIHNRGAGGRVVGVERLGGRLAVEGGVEGGGEGMEWVGDGVVERGK